MNGDLLSSDKLETRRRTTDSDTNRHVTNDVCDFIDNTILKVIVRVKVDSSTVKVKWQGETQTHRYRYRSTRIYTRKFYPHLGLFGNIIDSRKSCDLCISAVQDDGT